ncbi:unannotated protein [freshwater metagenome]|uniref:Unannotated protein n=1 Tax=freshwater metagenome TaxID=449393 RepID=A0A6J6DDH7_9ZZZZ
MVATLDFNRGRSLSEHLADPVGDELLEPCAACLTRRSDGRANAAGGVGRSGHPCLEFARAITIENEVRVRIDETGNHRTSATVDDRVDVVASADFGRSRGANPRHNAVIHNERSVVDDSQRDSAAVTGNATRRAQGGFVGDELADVREQRASHDFEYYPSSIGMRRPRVSATSTARSYPASTWRITPVPGSFVSTRASFSAASGVPSATVT